MITLYKIIALNGFNSRQTHENYSARITTRTQPLSVACNLFQNTRPQMQTQSVAGRGTNTYTQKNVIKLKYSNSENNYKPQTRHTYTTGNRAHNHRING